MRRRFQEQAAGSDKQAAGSDNTHRVAMTKSELISRLAAHFPQLVASDAELVALLAESATRRRLRTTSDISGRAFRFLPRPA